MKKVSVLLGVLMIFIFSSTAFAASFPDVSSSDWYYTAVNTMADEGIVRGYEDGRFRPNDNITRAEFVALLAKSSQDKYTGYSSSFSDVSATSWYKNVVGWAADKKIVSGVGGNKFAPNNTITRQDMVCMVCRYLEYKGIVLPAAATLYYADANTIDTYAKESVAQIFAYGGVNGIGDNQFSPKGKATRAEATQLLFNNTHRNQRQRCAMYAKNFEGFSYTTGGASPASGFDNVGFVSYVYSQFGVTLTGDAVSLQNVGTAVDINNLNMGDLVCFGGSTPLVGIYIGDGKIILAINAKNMTPGVYITKINSTYYYSNFVTGRRLFSV